MKYGNDSPVLKNISCVFKSQEKVFIHSSRFTLKSLNLETTVEFLQIFGSDWDCRKDWRWQELINYCAFPDN